jgi:hypothetical protein
LQRPRSVPLARAGRAALGGVRVGDRLPGEERTLLEEVLVPRPRCLPRRVCLSSAKSGISSSGRSPSYMTITAWSTVRLFGARARTMTAWRRNSRSPFAYTRRPWSSVCLCPLRLSTQLSWRALTWTATMLSAGPTSSLATIRSRFQTYAPKPARSSSVAQTLLHAPGRAGAISGAPSSPPQPGSRPASPGRRSGPSDDPGGQAARLPPWAQVPSGST